MTPSFPTRPSPEDLRRRLEGLAMSLHARGCHADAATCQLAADEIFLRILGEAQAQELAPCWQSLGRLQEA